MDGFDRLHNQLHSVDEQHCRNDEKSKEHQALNSARLDESGSEEAKEDGGKHYVDQCDDYLRATP